MLQEYSPNLEWLYTHRACNRAYREDEEYFVVSFAGHVKTATASAVMNDIRRGAGKGHLVGLIKDVLSRFGKIIGPTGERTFTWDSARFERALWKIFRGIYALESSTFLPEQWIPRRTQSSRQVKTMGFWTGNPRSVAKLNSAKWIDRASGPG